MMEILRRMGNGEGEIGHLKALEDLSAAMRLSSLCGLGQAVAVPVLDSLAYFRSEYETRISHSAFLRGIKGTKMFCDRGKALLDRNPDPNEEEIRNALGGNLCRCGTYPQHPKAVLDAAQELVESEPRRKGIDAR